MDKDFKLALCQMDVIDNKEENINKAIEMISTAAGNGAQMIALPEMFNCPYTHRRFAQYAEKVENENMGMTISAISKIAEKCGVYIIAGSIPELYQGKLYNTSFILDKSGKIIGRHRKIHLFDVDIPDGIRFKESDSLTAGEDVTVVDTEFCKIGVAICYDVRFPELMRLMALDGVKLIIIPAAFNMTTGPAHWEALMRVRAIDNQVYVAAASPARSKKSVYIAYGNSMIVEPWGTVLGRAEDKEEIVYADIGMERLKNTRNELPLLKHRREDLYSINMLKEK